MSGGSIEYLDEALFAGLRNISKPPIVREEANKDQETKKQPVTTETKPEEKDK